MACIVECLMHNAILSIPVCGGGEQSRRNFVCKIMICMDNFGVDLLCMTIPTGSVVGTSSVWLQVKV